MTKHSLRDELTPMDHAQLLGLKLLADRHVAMLDEIEAAMLAITGETDRNGKAAIRGDGTHCGDCANGLIDVQQLLDKLGLTVSPALLPQPEPDVVGRCDECEQPLRSGDLKVAKHDGRMWCVPCAEGLGMTRGHEGAG